MTTITRLPLEQRDALELAVEEAIEKTASMSPTEAAAAVINDRNYNENFAERVVERMNGKMASDYLASTPEPSRGDSIVLADIDAVKRACFAPVELSKAASELRTSTNYLEAPEYDFTPLYKAAAAPSQEEQLLQKKARIDSLRSALEKQAARLTQANERAEAQVQLAADDLAVKLANRNVGLDVMEKHLQRTYGQEQGTMYGALIEARNPGYGSFKRASKLTKAHDFDPTIFQPDISRLHDEARRLESTNADLSCATSSLEKAAAMLGGIDAEIALLHKAAEDAKDPYGGRGSWRDKVAASINVPIVSNFLPENAAQDNTALPSAEYQQATDAIRVRAMMAQLGAEDPVLSNYDTSDLIDAYNELAVIAPSATKNKASIVGMLRKYVEQGRNPQDRAMELFEVGQLADTDSKLNRPIARA